MNFTDLLPLQDQHTRTKATVDAQSVLIREPRLLVPGMQPIGPVKLNPTHPLRKYIDFAAIAGNPKDLVTGRRLTFVDVELSSCQNARTWKFNGTSSYIQDEGYPFRYAGNGIVSWLIVAYVVNDGTTQDLMSWGNAGAAEYQLFRCMQADTEDPIEVRVQNVGSSAVSSTWRGVPYSTLTTFFCEFRQDDAEENTVAGDSQQLMYRVAIDNAGAYANAFTEMSIGSQMISGSRAGFLNGHVAYAMGFYDFSISENLDVLRDPYQFLIPA